MRGAWWMVVLAACGGSGGGSGGDDDDDVVPDGSPPSVTIQVPTDGQTFLTGAVVSVAFVVADADGLDDVVTVDVVSDVDGLLAQTSLDDQGAGQATVRLSDGEHELLVRVVDAAGLEGLDSVVVTLTPR